MGPRMSIRRRGAAILTTCIALTAIGAGATPAAAQVTGVTATLSSQTPFATPQKPDVSIEVTARNDGPTPVDNLSLQATVWSQITTIGAYDAALRGDPSASTQIANP